MTWEWVVLPLVPIGLVLMLPAMLAVFVLSLIKTRNKFLLSMADEDAAFFCFLFGNLLLVFGILFASIDKVMVALCVCGAISLVIYTIGILTSIGVDSF